MDGSIVPAVAAGGRIAAAVLRRPNLKRRASLELSVEIDDLGSDPVVSLILSNPRKNLDAVEVLTVVPMVRIHNHSCTEPEFLPVRRGYYGKNPSGAFTVSPGESKTWQARFRMRDISDLEKQYQTEAMKRTWGETRYEEFIETEQRAVAFRKNKTRLARLARIVNALDESPPVLALLVSTKNDGQFESRVFCPGLTPIRSRVKAAWANPS